MIMDQSLYIFGITLSPQFAYAIELLLAGAVYASQMERRKHFVLKLSLLLAIYLLVSVIFGDRANYIIMPVVFICLLFILLAVCFRINWRVGLYYMLMILATQHLGVTSIDFMRQLIHVENTPSGTGLTLWNVSSAITYLVILLICFLFYTFRKGENAQVEIRSYRLLFAGTVAFVSEYFLRYRVIQVIGTISNPERDTIFLYLNGYSMLASLAVMVILVAQNREDVLTVDKKIIENLLKEREEQTRYSENTIEVMNLQAHDLRHQIARLKKRRKIDDSLEEMEKTVNAFDQFSHTGNDTLDIVLTEKGMFCSSNQILFTCMVNGALLSFVRPMDISSIFGNLIENAIEAELKEEAANRSVSLQVFEKNGFVCVHEENYCSMEVSFREGLPVTTKLGQGTHGFGTRSIQYVVNQYAGNVSFSKDGSRFIVDVIIPTQ